MDTENEDKEWWGDYAEEKNEQDEVAVDLA